MALVIVGIMLLGALGQRNVIILTTRLANVKKISPPTPGFDLFGIDIFKSGIDAGRSRSGASVIRCRCTLQELPHSAARYFS